MALRLNIYLNFKPLSVTTDINIYLNSVINTSKGLFRTSTKSPRTKASYFKLYCHQKGHSDAKAGSCYNKGLRKVKGY